MMPTADVSGRLAGFMISGIPPKHEKRLYPEDEYNM